MNATEWTSSRILDIIKLLLSHIKEKQMRYYILLFISCIALVSYSQKIDNVFKSMPDEFLPAFSEANKTMLLVDTSLSVIPYPLGEIEKLEYNDTFLSIKTSEVGTLQLKILPLVNNTQIIALIKTVCAKKMCDSNIRFFSEEWDEIDKGSILPKTPPHSFFDPAKLDDPEFKWAASHIDTYPLNYRFVDGSDKLEVKFDIKGYLSPKDFQKVAPYIKSEILSLSWNKSMFIY